MAKNKNTTPELIVQNFLDDLDVLYDKHVKDLPGNPDLVIPSIKLAILVHGCYWHKHSCMKFATSGDETIQHDRTVVRELKTAGYVPLILWECDVISHQNAIKKRLRLVIQNHTKRLSR
jgi:DNA mismatch endonuclease (patch repair protein)